MGVKATGQVTFTQRQIYIAAMPIYDDFSAKPKQKLGLLVLYALMEHYGIEQLTVFETLK